MSDVKLFKIESDQVRELPGDALQVERSLQLLFEANLEPLLGIRFSATEHSTGPVHGGRIDTLGLDEDDCPVILYPDSTIVRKTACHGAILGFVMGHDLRRLFVSR